MLTGGVTRAPRESPGRPRAVGAPGRIVGISLSLLVLLLPVACSVVAVAWIASVPDIGNRDAQAYWLAASKLRAGASIYRPYPPSGPHDPSAVRFAYLYPPVLPAVLAPVVGFGQAAFVRVWLGLLLACVWLYGASLARISGGNWKSVLVWTAVVFACPGTVRALGLGQADPVVWALVAAALAIPAFDGAGVAAATILKVYPAPIAAAVVLRKPRAWKGAIVVTVLSLGVGATAFGAGGFVSAWHEWVRHVLPSVSQGQLTGHDNYSLSAFPLRVAYRAGWRPTGALPLPLRVYLTGLAVGMPAIAFWAGRKREPVVQASAVLAASLLFAPLLRLSYLPLFLVPLAVACGRRRLLAVAKGGSEGANEQVDARGSGNSNSGRIASVTEVFPTS